MFKVVAAKLETLTFEFTSPATLAFWKLARKFSQNSNALIIQLNAMKPEDLKAIICEKKHPYRAPVWILIAQHCDFNGHFDLAHNLLKQMFGHQTSGVITTNAIEKFVFEKMIPAVCSTLKIQDLAVFCPLHEASGPRQLKRAILHEVSRQFLRTCCNTKNSQALIQYALNMPSYITINIGKEEKEKAIEFLKNYCRQCTLQNKFSEAHLALEAIIRLCFNGIGLGNNKKQINELGCGIMSHLVPMALTATDAEIVVTLAKSLNDTDLQRFEKLLDRARSLLEVV